MYVRQNNLPNKELGVIHLVLPLILLLVVIAGALVIYFGVIRSPLSIKLPNLVNKKEPTVTLQKQYQNPFDKSTQYVNPFSEYQNPFDSLK